MKRGEFRHIIVSTFYKLINPLRKLGWFIFRPQTRGVKAVIECSGDILLVQLTYADRGLWKLPGGGVDRGESPLQAVIREVKEEVGIRIPEKDPRFFYQYKSGRDYKDDTVDCFAIRVSNREFSIDGMEVREARWFPLNAVPADVPKSVREVLPVYSSFRNGYV